MATDKQKLARGRNWFKFRLMGNTSCVEQHYPSFTFSEKEKEIMQKIERLREQLIMEFDETSKHMGLTVLPKCWCGRVGKYPTDCQLIRSRNVTHSCKEHRDGN